MEPSCPKCLVTRPLCWLPSSELQKCVRPPSLTNVRRLQPPAAPVFEPLPSCPLFSLCCRIKRHESIEWDYILLAAAYSIFLAFWFESLGQLESLLFIMDLIQSSQTTLLLQRVWAVNVTASVAVLSERPPLAGHSGRLLRPHVWELHAAHLLLRLLTRLHLGEFNLGVQCSCVYVRKCIGAVLLMGFFPPSRQS